MKINEKIEMIRQQPDHVRIKWVWICVAISMFVVLVLWIFSMTSLFMKDEVGPENVVNENVENLGQQMKELQEQASSIKSLNSQISDEIENADKAQYPYMENNTASTPQSKNYSNLMKENTEE